MKQHTRCNSTSFIVLHSSFCFMHVEVLSMFSTARLTHSLLDTHILSFFCSPRALLTCTFSFGPNRCNSAVVRTRSVSSGTFLPRLIRREFWQWRDDNDSWFICSYTSLCGTWIEWRIIESSLVLSCLKEILQREFRNVAVIFLLRYAEQVEARERITSLQDNTSIQ